MIVVIDGPAGSGKSSTARAVAERLKIQFLDSGALYRVATLIYLNSQNNGDSFFDALKESDISFYFKEKKFHVLLNHSDVSDEIRAMHVANAVSTVAAMPEVRAFVNALMRQAVQSGIYIADGRDLGTAVFPDAELKFFMVADLDERARRRLSELEAKGEQTTFDEVRKNIEDRDLKDSSRASDPLKQADDAILVNTSGLTFEDQVQMISEHVQQLIAKNA